MTARSAARAWFAVLAVLVAAALLVQVVLIVQGGADANSGETGAVAPLGTRLVRLAGFFTIESNVLVLALAVSLALAPDRDGRLWRVLQLDALIGIAITGVVFSTVLAAVVHPTGLAAVVNVVFHYIVPIAAVLGWLVFGPRPRVDGTSLLYAGVWPVAWIAWTLLHGAVTGWYPYPFLDGGRLGAVVAARNVGFVVIGAVLVGLLVWWADRRLPALTSRRAGSAAV